LDDTNSTLIQKPKHHQILQNPDHTPVDKFYHWETTTPTNNFLRQPIAGVWHTWTYAEAGDTIRRIASSLKAMGLPPKSNIAILSKNCAHWIMADFAIWLAGHVSVPVYPTLSADGIRYILEHSETKVIFVGKLDDFSKQQNGVPSSIKQIKFPHYGAGSGVEWDTLLKADLLKQNFRPSPDDLSSIMYSSGTTGTPKGVMIPFRAMNFVGETMAMNLIKQPEQFFSYLPLSHIAEKAYLGMGALYSGSSIAFTESLDKFGANLMEIQPTIFGGVPRIFAKLQEGVLNKLPQKKLDTLLRIPIVSSFIKRAIRKKLGFGRLKIIVGGAAPIPVSILEWFSKLGINIAELYGMTENCGFSHGDHGSNTRFGTVGRPWKDVDVKLSDEGEILIKHPGLMLGYYKDAQTTAETFTGDGFLKTGDKGVIDREGYLTITGRIKDQFKTDKAKFVAPGPIETKLLANKDIEQVCVVGMGIPQPIALIVLSAAGKSKSKSDISQSLDQTIDAVNKTLEHFEQLEKAVIMKSEWTIENGLMTPSLKVKRNEIEKIYLKNYPLWYKEDPIVVWEG
jgi:long-chain acyl-CoA synthetase